MVGQSVGRQRHAVPPHKTHSCGAHGCAVVVAALKKGQCALRQGICMGFTPSACMTLLLSSRQ